MTPPQPDQVAARVGDLIRAVPGFPAPGVTFRDITPLLADGEAFAGVVGHLAQRYRGRVDLVAGIEARGFLFAAPLALALGVGVLPIRKQGKLPPPTRGLRYELEYGTAAIEVGEGMLAPAARVLIVDDVLATGGTAAAAAALVEQEEAEVVALAFIMELSSEHDGRSALPGREVYTLAAY